MQRAEINDFAARESLIPCPAPAVPEFDWSPLRLSRFALTMSTLAGALTFGSSMVGAQCELVAGAKAGSVNVNCLMPAAYLVGSYTSIGIGGNYVSDNLPYQVDFEAWPDSLKNEPLQLIAEYNSSGLQLAIVNASSAPMYFDAQDSQLELVQQALAPDGTWRDIEYITYSWCGNSYHQVSLPPGQGWLVPAPVYSGENETMLRFKLNSYGTKKSNTEVPLYSNPFPGRVNHGQFYFSPGEAFLEQLIR